MKLGQSPADVNAVISTIELRGCTPLHLAAETGNYYAVRKLCEAGADVDKTDRYDITPLQMAARYGHAECVRTLLRAGAKVDAASHDG